MEYQYGKRTDALFANGLNLDRQTGTLTWQCRRGQDTLLVQTPYDRLAEPVMEELCAQLNRAWQGGLPENSFVPVMERVSVRLVRAEAYARDRGCPLNGHGSCYTVFPCQIRQDGIMEIFAPTQGGGVIQPFFRIPLRVQVSVQPFIRRSLLGKPIATGFYSISLSFPDSGKGGGVSCYGDGDLEYAVCGIRIPITREMAEMGIFYIRSAAPPEPAAWSGGIRIVPGQEMYWRRC